MQSCNIKKAYTLSKELEDLHNQRERVAKTVSVTLYVQNGNGHHLSDNASVKAARDGVLSLLDEQINGVMRQMENLGVTF